MTNFWDSTQEELRGLNKEERILIFAGFLHWMSASPGMLLNENVEHRIPHSTCLFCFLFSCSFYTVLRAVTYFPLKEFQSNVHVR